MKIRCPICLIMFEKSFKRRRYCSDCCALEAQRLKTSKRNKRPDVKLGNARRSRMFQRTWRETRRGRRSILAATEKRRRLYQAGKALLEMGLVDLEVTNANGD